MLAWRKTIFLGAGSAIAIVGAIYFQATKIGVKNFPKFLQKSQKIFSLQLDCELRNNSGELLKKFSSYDQCIFLSNGDVIATQETEGVYRLNSVGDSIWKIPIRPHHQINLMSNRNELIFASKDIFQFAGEPTRFDVVVKADLHGRVLQEWHLKEHWAEIKKRLGIKKEEYWPASPPDKERGVSHLNSIHEIPENNLARKLPQFMPGNILVNLFGPHRIALILSPDLSKILSVWQNSFDSHDLQLLPSGELLAYVNESEHGHAKFSEIRTWNPETQEQTWNYKRDGFYSPMWGSIQPLDNGDYWIFTDHSDPGDTTIRLVNRSGEELWSLPLKNDRKKHKRRLVFRALIQDFTSFLDHNRS